MHRGIALPSVVDPLARARDLVQARELILSGETPQIHVRTSILDSWLRVQRCGVDPETGRATSVISRDDIEQRRRDSRLADVLDIIRGGLTAFADDGMHMVVITDDQARVLWREGNAAVKRRADHVGFVEGSSSGEDAIGTNGIGTALAIRAPIQVFAAEHFVRANHHWVCSAAPVRDPVNGRVLGIIDVSGPPATIHPSTLALVESVSKLVTLSLKETHSRALDRLRNLAVLRLSRMSRPAIVTDRHGWVAASEGVWVGDRVQLPDSFAGSPGYISPLGRCVAEPLFDGWIISAEPSAENKDVGVRLTVHEGPPVIEVSAPSGSWRHQLSLRHAEILTILATSPDGRTAVELSDDLFGDPTRTMTVRAELTRVRKRLGSLLTYSPYRFANWLQVRCDFPVNPVDLLPGSKAPYIARLRQGLT